MINFSSLRNRQKQGGMTLYIVIAVILMVITYVEFAIVEYKDALPLGRNAILFWLFALSIVKYALVVWIFMHLKDDETLLTGLFSAGMLIGGGTVAALLLAFTVFNVSKVQRSPYMPTTNYSRATYDRMAIAEFGASDFIDALDNPAPKNQVFAVAPYDAPVAESLNLPQLNLVTPDFSQEQGSVDTPQTVIQIAPTHTGEHEPSTSDSYVVSDATVDVEDVTDTTGYIVPEVEVISAISVVPDVATESVASDDADDLLNQVTSLREQLEQLEQALASQDDSTQVVQTEVIESVTTTLPPAPTPEDSVQELTLVEVPEPTTEEIAQVVGQEVSEQEDTPQETLQDEVVEQEVAEQETVESEVVEQEVTQDIVESGVSYDWDWQSKGESAYLANCMSCHQATGEGIVGAFPSIKGHIPTIYNAEGGREYLANLVLYGLQGQITVDGASYNGVMTGLSYVSDEDLAAILNHELTSWGNADLIEGDFAPIVPEEIAAARATQRTMADVYTLRQGLNLP